MTLPIDIQLIAAYGAALIAQDQWKLPDTKRH
jgi:activator of 2-hydroxyglutaryl-CoA dehydratase